MRAFHAVTPVRAECENAPLLNFVLSYDSVKSIDDVDRRPERGPADTDGLNSVRQMLWTCTVRTVEDAATFN